MKKLFSSMLLVLILFATAYSDDASQKTVAEELLLIMEYDKMMEPNYQEIRDMMSNMSKQMNIPEEERDMFNNHLDRMVQLIENEFGWENFKDDLIRFYQKTFTEDELKAFISFYKTPAGQKYIEKGPLLEEMFMELSQKNMLDMFKKMEILQSQMIEELHNERAKRQEQEINKKDTTEL